MKMIFIFIVIVTSYIYPQEGKLVPNFLKHKKSIDISHLSEFGEVRIKWSFFDPEQVKKGRIKVTELKLTDEKWLQCVNPIIFPGKAQMILGVYTGFSDVYIASYNEKENEIIYYNIYTEDEYYSAYEMAIEKEKLVVKAQVHPILLYMGFILGIIAFSIIAAIFSVNKELRYEVEDSKNAFERMYGR